MDFKNEMKQLQSLFDAEKFDEVLQKGDSLIDDFEQEIDLFLLLSQAALKTEKYADANYFLLKAKAIEANNLDVLLLLAALKVMTKDTIGAQEYYQQVLSIDANNVTAQTAIADLFYADGLYNAAIENYTKAIELGAKDKLEKNDYALVIYKAASSHLAEGNATAALAFLQAHKPSTFDEMVGLVTRKIHTALENRVAVIEATIELHQHVPEQPSYIFDWIQFINDDNAKKEELYGKLFELKLNEIEKVRAYQGRAVLHTENGNWKGAVEDLTQAISIDPSWFSYQQRAVANEQLNEKNAALKDWTQAIKLVEKPYQVLHMRRGELLLKAGVYDKAVNDFNKVLELTNQSSSAAYYNLGIAYNKQGDKSAAFKMLVKADTLGHTKAHDLLIKSFSSQLAKIRQKKSAQLGSSFDGEATRNQKSPILSKAFGKLWVPDMSKFLRTIEAELKTYPATIMKKVLEETSKDLFLITPNGLLFIEGSQPALEAYYRVEVESEHSILLEVQATKGGNIENMRLSFYEDNLMVSYPINDTEVPPKYFLEATQISDEQKKRLVTKDIEIPYLSSIESSIATLVES